MTFGGSIAVGNLDAGVIQSELRIKPERDKNGVFAEVEALEGVLGELGSQIEALELKIDSVIRPSEAEGKTSPQAALPSASSILQGRIRGAAMEASRLVSSLRDLRDRIDL